MKQSEKKKKRNLRCVLSSHKHEKDKSESNREYTLYRVFTTIICSATTKRSKTTNAQITGPSSKSPIIVEIFIFVRETGPDAIRDFTKRESARGDGGEK